MSYSMPDLAKDYLKTAMIPTHKIWWMRTELINLEALTVTSPGGGAPGQYFRIEVMDIDAEEGDRKVYDFDIGGAKFKDYRPKDRISLFGHEPLDAERLSHPRFFFHHEMIVSGPCYEKHFIDRNFFPINDFIATTAGSKRYKKVKFWEKVSGAVGLLPEDVTKRFITGGGFDMKPIYKEVSGIIDAYIMLNPDPKFPCVNPRAENQHQGGKLVD